MFQTQISEDHVSYISLRKVSALFVQSKRFLKLFQLFYKESDEVGRLVETRD